jgi:phospholipase/lecithinase/hemolysin
MNDRKQLQQVFALALVMVLLAGCGGAPAEPIATPIPISHVYAFGDSFSDNGNLKQLAPSDPWWDTHWEGRTSNGLVAVEVLADRLSVELTDYAVTGAKSDTSNVNPRFPSTGALGQLEKFKTELDGHSADPNALYFVMIGVNDFFEVLTDFPIDNPTLTDQTVDNIATLITQLAQLGAKRFLVINSADTAVMPYVIANGRSDDAAEFQTLINSKLSSRLDELKSQLEIEITSFDYVTLSTRIRENPSDYGLSNLTDACQPVFLGVKPACASPDQYFFWDEVHPTRRVHQIFGEAWAALYGT